jgi:hypothetical protein
MHIAKERSMKGHLRSDVVIATILVLAATLAASPAVMAKEDWKDQLREKLYTVYEPTKQSLTGVSKPGTVLVVQKDGVVGQPPSPLAFVNVVRDGRIEEAYKPSKGRNFNKGERLYLTHIKVNDTELKLGLLTVNTYQTTEEGTSKDARYHLYFQWTFPEGYLPTASLDDIKKAIDPFLLREDEATAAKTIELGQTPEQVEEILGRPQKIINLGEKVIYVYPDMKVIFLEGKVADVQ